MSNVTRTPPKHVSVKNTFINASSIGSTLVIPAAPGMAIRIISLVIISTGANSVSFSSDANPITASFPLGANGGVVMSFNEHGWAQTNEGEALNVNMTAATPTAIQLNYMVL